MTMILALQTTCRHVCVDHGAFWPLPIFHCCTNNLSAPPLAAHASWLAAGPSPRNYCTSSRRACNEPLWRIFCSTAAPPPPGDIKHPATCPPPLPALRRLPNCPVRGQAELTKWDLTGVSLLGTGWSGRCQLSTHAPRLLLPQCSRGQWPGSRGVRVCLGLGQMNHTVDHNTGTLPFYDSEVNPASR